ncbi:MAG: PH domain-containing protein [Deltaproteobacteria bacterium]|nr:PH domain-containing protein [Deltaproteobacteria bacterium]
MTTPDDADPSNHRDEETLFDGHPARIATVGALLLSIATLGLALIVYELRRRSIHYRVTTQRIVIERGLFSRRMDQLDVYRITDYSVEVPFAQRLVGTGNLILRSMDPTTPEVRLDALKTDVRGLYENLRRATELEKQRRGVRVVDQEAHVVPSI